MLITNLRLRTITTGLFHYEDAKLLAKDLCAITGEKELFPIMFPAVRNAVLPWLRLHVTDSRFWNGALDLSHEGETELPDPSEADRAQMRARMLEDDE